MLPRAEYAAVFATTRGPDGPLVLLGEPRAESPAARRYQLADVGGVLAPAARRRGSARRAVAGLALRATSGLLAPSARVAEALVGPSCAVGPRGRGVPLGGHADGSGAWDLVRVYVLEVPPHEARALVEMHGRMTKFLARNLPEEAAVVAASPRRRLAWFRLEDLRRAVVHGARGLILGNAVTEGLREALLQGLLGGAGADAGDGHSSEAAGPAASSREDAPPPNRRASNASSVDSRDSGSSSPDSV